MNIKAVIVDDEEHNCSNLRNLLQRYCSGVNVVGIANSVASAVEIIKDNSPDIVFLDIEMPGGSGFDLLQNFENYNFDVVFVTAYDQYAIKAIRFCAIDYLLKPIDYQELIVAVNRVLEKKKQNTQQVLYLQNYLENSKANFLERKIALVSAERHLFVKIRDIIRCEGENNYTHVFLTSGEKILVSRTLKDFEELLEEGGFIRVHQSHLINREHIHSFEKKDGGHIQMCDKSVVFISRQRKEKVMEMFAKWKL